MPQTSYSFGPYQLCPSEQLLLRGNESMPLAPKAFELLVALVASQGRLMKREELMKAVWADSFVEEINLTVNVSLLRKVLGSMPDGRAYIETVPKRGYRFLPPVIERTGAPARNTPPVEDLMDTRSPVSTAEFAPAVQYPEPVTEQGNGPGRRLPQEIAASLVSHSSPADVAGWTGTTAGPGTKSTRTYFGKFRLLAVILVTLVIVAIAGLWVIRARQRDLAKTTGIHSLAVLPFQSIGDPSLSYLGLGMTDALVTRLGNQSRMTVRTMSAVRKYVGETDPLRVGRELGVDAVLDGTIQRSAGQTRVTVQLLQVASGRTLWTSSFDEASETSFALEDAISQRMAKDLLLNLSEQEQQKLAAPHTRNGAAYDLYTQGRVLLNARSVAATQASIGLFQQAIRADPNYAAAYAGLADAYILAGSYGNSFLSPSVAAPKAEESVTRALELDESSAEAHTSLAYLRLTYDWNWLAAETEFRRAIELNPRYGDAHHWYSHELLALERVDESHRQSEQALALDPTGVLMNEHMAWHHLFARQYFVAIAQAEKAVEIDPNFVQAHRVLGLAYLYSGDGDRACPEFATGVSLSHEDPIALAYLARCYALTHKQAQAREIVTSLESAATERYISAAEIAAVHAALGDKAIALRWLGRACDERAGALIYLNIDPVFDAMRDDPAFQRIVERVGLPKMTPLVRSDVRKMAPYGEATH